MLFRSLQSGIQLTWPHAGTDWAYMLKEVQECFVNIAREIAKRELLLIVTPEPEEVKKQIVATVNMDNVRFLRCETNDTFFHNHALVHKELVQFHMDIAPTLVADTCIALFQGL